jgi:HEAT repeat protein
MNTDELRTALLACEGGLAEAPLAKTLAEGDFDVVTISDPDGMALEQAVRIAAALLKAGAGFEVRLAQRSLMASPGEQDNGRRRRIRTIDILRRTLRSSRLMPFQVQLMRQEDPFVRSKAAQYIAELTNNSSWFYDQLKDPDARVRANAVEALWNSSMADAEEVFRQALLDAHHRVTTTALVGLWLLGKRDEGGERLIALCESEAAPTRAAAAWAMGALGDRRFLDALLKLTQDDSALVRPRAFHSLRQIERVRREATQLTT